MTFKSLICAAFIAATPISAAMAADAAPAPLAYVVHPPSQPSEHPPMLVLLHGYGADETDLLDLADALPPQLLTVSLRAPIPLGTGGYMWFHGRRAAGRFDGDAAEADASRAAIDATLDALQQKFQPDSAHIFIGGFSQGGYMTYRMLLAEPQRFRGGLALSGALFSGQAAELREGKRDLSALHLFIGHGENDDNVPFATAEEARDLLAAGGADIAFHGYAGMGHSIDTAETQDIAAWLQQRMAP